MAQGAYYGPAGIFSTDDPGADQRQIDEELFEDPFDDEDIYPSYWDFESELEESATIEVIAYCTQEPWYDWRTIPEDTYEAFEESTRADHATHCSCGDPGNFDVAEIN